MPVNYAGHMTISALFWFCKEARLAIKQNKKGQQCWPLVFEHENQRYILISLAGSFSYLILLVERALQELAHSHLAQ